MLWQDVRHALRSLRRKPSFTVVVVCTLAIGIGGTTAIFGAVNAVLLRPLPYPQPDQLVRVYKTSVKDADRVGGVASPPDFTDWRRDNRVFSEVAATDVNSVALTGAGAAEQVPAGLVTGGFFDVMGERAALGRTITTADDPIGSRDVVVLSHELWARRFGSDPALIGRQIVLDGVSSEVIGVMPAGFQYPLRCEIWLPLRFSARDLETQRGAHYIDVVARLKSDASLSGPAKTCAPSPPGSPKTSPAPIATTRPRCIRCTNPWWAASGNRCSCCWARSGWC